MNLAPKILTGQEYGSQLLLPDGNFAKKFGSTMMRRDNLKTKFQSLKTNRLNTFDHSLVRDIVSSMRSLTKMSSSTYAAAGQ